MCNTAGKPRGPTGNEDTGKKKNCFHCKKGWQQAGGGHTWAGPSEESPAATVSQLELTLPLQIKPWNN